MNIYSLLVTLIVIVAVVYSIRRLYKRLKGLPGYCCDCSLCSVEESLCKQFESPFNGKQSITLQRFTERR